MATVIFMRFNKDQGAIIADESTWHLGHIYGYRRTNYGDSILNLFPEEQVQKNGLAAVYAGIGFPCFHYEVFNNLKEELKTDDKIKNIKSLSKKALFAYQKTHNRYINDKLGYYCGFNSDEFNNLSFENEKKSYNINQDEVLKHASKILKFKDKSDAFMRIFDNTSVLMGYDKESGINAYYVGHDYKMLDFSSALSSMGTGGPVLTKYLSDFISKKNLSERRAGFNFMEGLYLTLAAALEVKKSHGKVGGYFQLFLFDGKAEKIEKNILEKSDHGLKLAIEAAQCEKWGFIEKDFLLNIYDRLIFKNEDYLEVEKDLFAKSKDPELMGKYLLGYKPVLTPYKNQEKKEA